MPLRLLDMETEKQIETYLRDKVKELGGRALKWVSPSFTGVPDRIVLLPGATIFFAEIKSPGKKLRPRQSYVKRWLESLGFTVYKIDSKKQVKEILNEIYPV